MDKSSVEYLETDYEVAFATLVSEIITPDFKSLQSLIIQEINQELDEEVISKKDFGLSSYVAGLFFFQLAILLDNFVSNAWDFYYLRISILANQQGWLETHDVAFLLGYGGKVTPKIEQIERTVNQIDLPENEEDLGYLFGQGKERLKLVREKITNKNDNDIFLLAAKELSEVTYYSHPGIDSILKKISKQKKELIYKLIADEIRNNHYPKLIKETKKIASMPIDREQIYLVHGEYIPNNHPDSRKSEILQEQKQASIGCIKFLFFGGLIIYIIFLLFVT